MGKAVETLVIYQFNQDGGGSEPDDVDLGPRDLSMMVVIAVGRVGTWATDTQIWFVACQNT